MDINKFIDNLQSVVLEQSAKCGGEEMFLYMHPDTATHLSKMYEQEILGCTGDHGTIKRIGSAEVVTKRWMDPDLILVGPRDDTTHVVQLKFDV